MSIISVSVTSTIRVCLPLPWNHTLHLVSGRQVLHGRPVPNHNLSTVCLEFLVAKVARRAVLRRRVLEGRCHGHVFEVVYTGAWIWDG